VEHFEAAVKPLGYRRIRGVITWPTEHMGDEEVARRRAGWFLRRGYVVRQRVHGDWELERTLS
jgi:hypothetical protein